MSRQTDIGESSASIRRRTDNDAWPRVREALASGATLQRPQKLRDYYTRCKDPSDPLEGIGVSATFVRNMEINGTLIRVGVDTYGLVTS